MFACLLVSRYKQRAQHALIGGYYTVRPLPKTRHFLGAHPALALFLLALALRLAFVLIIEPSPVFEGGDTNWYMQNGRDLVTTGKTAGPLQTAPLYPLLTGVAQVIVPGGPTEGRAYNDGEMQLLRVTQAILAAVLVASVYRLAARLFSARAGWLAGLIAAISPSLIIEAGNLITEGVFLCFIFGGLALYARALDGERTAPYAAAGALFALATLTRAVFLLFPLGIIAHLWLVRRRAWARPALALLIAYTALLAPWTVYNLAVWDRLVIAGDGLLGFVHQGATGKASPRDVDADLGLAPGDASANRQEALRARIRESIFDDPAGWAAHRVKELGGAILQPHNTVYFPGESIRDAVADWLREDRTVSGLRDLTRIEAFWPKLALYIFHYAGLLLGAAGMVWARRRWRALLPLYGVAAYFLGIHLVLLALPRYLFPLYPVLWMFAAAWLVEVAFPRLAGSRSL